MDSVAASGPPDVINIKGTSLPFTAQVRQTKKSKAWESYTLSGIANEIAGTNGLSCMFESANDPFYERVEQRKTSDSAFLAKLCKDAGISLKATDGQLVLFDQSKYEAQPPCEDHQAREGGRVHQLLAQRGIGRPAVQFLPRQLHGPRQREVH